MQIYTITFKSEIADDIVKYVFNGYDLTDVPEVPEKEGQTSSVWDITDFGNITEDLTVNAVYDMRKYITFHNEYTDDADIIKVVNYGEELTEIPEITQKTGNTAKWSITDFRRIENDLLVQAVYETQGLQYVAINQQTEYRVSQGEMTANELFIPAEYNGKPVTVIDEGGFRNSFNIIKAYLSDSITEIRSGAFYYCQYLIEITLSDKLMSIGNEAFMYCYSLQCITIPDSVTNIGNDTFNGCISLKSVILPNGITRIVDGMFAGCNALTDIIIPDSVNKISTIAFWNCSSLTNINIPNGVTFIGGRAFENCTSLTTMNIPDNLGGISEQMFYGCQSLTYLIIPNNIKFIGGSAFYGCKKFETIYYKGSESEFEKITVYDGNSAFTDSMVYYYSETEPTESNKFWHYDTDGVTPVI